MKSTVRLAVLTLMATWPLACTSTTSPPGVVAGGGGIGGGGGGGGTGGGDAGVVARACDNGTLPATIEAEALLLDGLTARDGGDGVGYVDAFDQPGKRIGFTLCIPADGYYTLTFRYANGTGNEATRTLVVDGVSVPGKLRFIARADPSRWEPVAESATPRKSVRLAAGHHLVELSFDGDDRGTFSLDNLVLSAGPQPSLTSVATLMMNNWGSLVASHYGGQTNPQFKLPLGPRLGSLNWQGDWPTNQVDEAAGFLRDDTIGHAYVDFTRNPFQSNQALRQDGAVVVDYLSWGETPLTAAVQKEYALVPNEDFLLVRYTLTNVTSLARSYSLLEYVHPNNKEGLTGSHHLTSTWRDDLQAWVVDLSATNGTFVIIGALQPATAHGTNAFGATNGLIGTYTADGSLNGAATATGADLEVGFLSTLPIAPGASATVDYYYAVGADLASVEAIAARVNGQTVAQWFTKQASSWASWLATGKAPATTDPALRTAYALSLISMKEAQGPFGSFVASTNPAYSFKVWPRDSAAVAIGFDGAGFTADAEKFWLWMAQAQEDGHDPDFPPGTWETNYDYWHQHVPIGFVAPEWDSLGLFIVGVYQHYELLLTQNPTLAAAFLAKVEPAVIAAAQFIESGVNQPLVNHGFGPADFSIWEDKYEWAGFTQTTYAAGLYAAHLLAAQPGFALIDGGAGWLAAARTIKAQLVSPYTAGACGGLWNPTGNFLYRGILPDCTPDLRVDSSVNLVAVLGLLDVNDAEAAGLRKATVARLQPEQGFNTQGISRFENDEFYYTSIYSPGGQYECKVPEPVWPQMSMYVGMAEHWTGNDASALARLHWVVSVMGVGFTAPGEAVDWSTQQLMVSTAIEPVTASWFVLGVLNYLDQYDTRLPADPGH